MMRQLLTIRKFLSVPVVAFGMTVQIPSAISIEEIHVVSTIFDEADQVAGFCYDPPDWVWVDEPDAVQEIKQNLVRYYTEVDGRRAYIEVVEINGEEHIKTVRDGYGPNNLLELDPCPDRPKIV